MLTCAKSRKEKGKKKRVKTGEEWTVHLRGTDSRAGRRRLITLVNLSDVFQEEKKSLADGTLSIARARVLISLVNSYYNWGDCSDGRKSRLATIGGVVAAAASRWKSRRYLYKSFRNDGRPRALRMVQVLPIRVSDRCGKKKARRSRRRKLY